MQALFNQLQRRSPSNETCLIIECENAQASCEIWIMAVWSIKKVAVKQDRQNYLALLGVPRMQWPLWLVGDYGGWGYSCHYINCPLNCTLLSASAAL